MNNRVFRLAVLMTCHNRKNKTLECLKHLYEQKGQEKLFSLHVFLVDDGSTDGTGEAVKTYPINYVKGDGNLYWSRGTYTAWVAAENEGQFDFYLWLNDDTLLYPEAIESLIGWSAIKDHQCVIAGPACSKKTGELTYSGYADLQRDTEKLSPNGNLQEILLMNGNCVLIPEAVYKKTGKIDSLFIHSTGDFDFALRAHKKGIKIFVGKSFVGTCESDKRIPLWRQEQAPLRKRIQNYYSPLGYSQPYPYFIFNLRHFGLFTALKVLLGNHLRLFFPFLWKLKKR